MSVWKRIVSEFSIGFVVAVAWATFRSWPFRAEWAWAGLFIANFGAAFFIVSWFTGQYVRIRRQHATEQSLGTIERLFGHVLDNQVQMTTAFSGLAERVNDYLAKGLALPPSFAKELSGANTKLAEANSSFAAVLSTLNSLPLQAETPLPLRVQHNPAALVPASDYVPMPPPPPTWPPRST